MDGFQLGKLYGKCSPDLPLHCPKIWCGLDVPFGHKSMSFRVGSLTRVGVPTCSSLSGYNKQTKLNFKKTTGPFPSKFRYVVVLSSSYKLSPHLCESAQYFLRNRLSSKVWSKVMKVANCRKLQTKVENFFWVIHRRKKPPDSCSLYSLLYCDKFWGGLDLWLPRKTLSCNFYFQKFQTTKMCYKNGAKPGLKTLGPIWLVFGHNIPWTSGFNLRPLVLLGIAWFWRKLISSTLKQTKRLTKPLIYIQLLTFCSTNVSFYQTQPGLKG